MKIKIKNNIYGHIISSDSNIQTIRNWLRVKKPNADSISRFGKGWGDEYKYFVTKSGRFHLGLLPKIVEKYGDYIEDIEDLRKDVLTWDKTLVDNHEISLRPYQERVVDSYPMYVNDIKFFRGVIDAATNAGKSYCIWGLIQGFNVPKTLILVHRTLLLHQLGDFLEEQFGCVGKIGDGSWEYGQVTIATYQSLTKTHKEKKKSDIAKTLLKDTELLIVDECHNVVTTGKNNTYYKLLNKINAYGRYMFSGSPHRNGLEKLDLMGLSGEYLCHITNAELIDKKVSLKPIVEVHKVNDSNTYYDYQDALEGLYMSLPRLSVVKNYITTHLNKQILIIVDKSAHGRAIAESIPEVEFIDSKDSLKHDKIKMFNDRELRVLCSTMILKEGINLPSIEILIQASPTKSVVTIKQVTGRALRTDGKNETVKVVDFLDTHSAFKESASTRLKIYEKEGFDVTIYDNLRKIDYCSQCTDIVDKNCKELGCKNK